MFENKVHYWLKPGMNFLGQVMGHYFTKAAAEKDADGWNVKLMLEFD